MVPWRCQLFLLFMVFSGSGWAQTALFTLEDCRVYALAHEPGLLAIRQEDSIVGLDNRIALSAWKPQVGVTGNLRNNIKQQVSIFPDLLNPGSGETQEVTVGTRWVSLLGASLDQLIYSPEVTRDARLQDHLRERARLQILERKLEVKAVVSRAFYLTLRAKERINLLAADLERLNRSLRDARLLYDEGIQDKVDYKRATIARNRAAADLGVARLNLKSQTATLKQAMGFPGERPLELVYRYTDYTDELDLDNLPELEPRQRVELKAVLLDQVIQDENTDYFRRAWRPRVSATAAYNFNWQSNAIGELYGRSFPNAFAGLNLNIPLFQGGGRFLQVEQNEVRALQLDYEAERLLRLIEQEFTVAKNDYQAAMVAFRAALENAELAQEVFDVVLLQYREGLEPFLEVVIAETDLQTTRLNSLDQLIQAMIARVDLELAAGTL
jgi:outer membrane protein TolC